jgi:hypothetical protein
VGAVFTDPRTVYKRDFTLFDDFRILFRHA